MQLFYLVGFQSLPATKLVCQLKPKDLAGLSLLNVSFRHLHKDI